MKVVVDTNVLISGLFYGGNPEKIILGVMENTFQAYGNIEIMKEYIVTIDSIKKKYGFTDNNKNIISFLNKINIVLPRSNLNICRDLDDNKFINCAIDSNSSYVVSGDLDLLSLKSVGKIKIIKPKEFCKKFLN